MVPSKPVAQPELGVIPQLGGLRPDHRAEGVPRRTQQLLPEWELVLDPRHFIHKCTRNLVNTYAKY